MHVLGGEGIDRKVGDPITEFVVTHCDEISLFAVKGVADGKFRTTSIAMIQQIRWIYALAQEEGIPIILCP